ncbi:MAG TPA: hypothetical protein VFQ20_08805 [Burkholderiaceae bacterium]|nr:hypothetical protein [Burkholderiaceae bacterium]
MNLEGALQSHGLLLRGGFAPQASDAVPPLRHGRVPRWLALVGVAGAAFWPHFVASPQYADGAPHPLDRWSRAVGDALAARAGGHALYPFGGPPHHPFQRWVERAEGLHASPLGLRLHPRYGLWHSYRFALALPAAPDARPAHMDRTDHCARCASQPCLSACPVNAFTGSAYRAEACVDHLLSQPEPACRATGCLARHACPLGQAFAPRAEQARFHMDAFVADMAGRGG